MWYRYFEVLWVEPLSYFILNVSLILATVTWWNNQSGLQLHCTVRADTWKMHCVKGPRTLRWNTREIKMIHCPKRVLSWPRDDDDDDALTRVRTQLCVHIRTLVFSEAMTLTRLCNSALQTSPEGRRKVCACRTEGEKELTVSCALFATTTLNALLARWLSENSKLGSFFFFY